MKAVAAADEVAGEFLVGASVMEPNSRPAAARKIMDADVGRFEQNLSAIGQPAVDQVFHHLLLAIDGHAFAHQLAEIDVVQRAAEAEMHAIVEHAFALHARADTGLDQEVARPLLDQAGADAALDMLAATALQYYGLDALEMEKMR